MPQVVDVSWSVIGHVDPPDARDSEDRQLFYYLGPNLYPAGLYMPKGYDLERRQEPGEDILLYEPAHLDEGPVIRSTTWSIWRARDTLTGQIMTIWAVHNDPRTFEEIERGIQLPNDWEQTEILDA